MDTNRRDALKLSATAALSGMMMTNALAAADSQPPVVVEPLTGKAGFRVANYLPRMGATSRLGLVTNDGLVIDIPAEASRQKLQLSFDPTSMISLAGSGNKGLLELAALFKNRGTQAQNVNQVLLLSPIPKPQSNIYCVGWNYLDHFDEGKERRADQGIKEYPKVPVLFTKGTQTMNGPYDPIPYDGSYSTMIDWEAELAVVIGKKGKNISEENAMDHVFGYSAYNDTTARDVQQKRHSGQNHWAGVWAHCWNFRGLLCEACRRALWLIECSIFGFVMQERVSPLSSHSSWSSSQARVRRLDLP